MRRKTVLALGLTVCMVAGMTGCGSSGTSSEGNNEASKKGSKDTITLLSWYNEDYMKEFLDEFEKEEGIKVDLQYAPPVQQYVDKFSVLAASGQMTDMFFTAAENKQEVMEKGLADDISDMEVFQRIDPKVSETYGEDGKIYAYSPDAWVAGIFYNKDLFEKAGITEEPQTWDEFVEDCKLLKETGVEPYVDDSENVHNLPMDLYCSGVIGQDRDSDKEINDGDSTFEEKYTDTFNTWYADMIESGLYSQVSLGLNSNQVQDMFVTGQAAMMHGGTWTINDLKNKNPDLNYGMFILGDKEGNKVAPGAVNVGLSISSSSKNKEACKKFIEFMSRDENILKWQKVTNNVIVVSGIDYELGSVIDAFKEDAVEGNFYLSQIVWKNSSGIFKELLTSVQDAITGADTAGNISLRLDKKMEELNK